MSVDFTVVSIGTLSSNPFWHEPGDVRTAHATTTLVRDGERLILVDPSLPDAALAARLHERTGLRPEQITDVFCTTLRPTHRRSLELFEKARWFCGEGELEAYRRHLETLAGSANRLSKEDEAAIAADAKRLMRFAPAEDAITSAVSLFPLLGPSVGSCGLLLAGMAWTAVVAGDAALTVEHVLAGRVWDGSADAEAALESLSEILEIADLIVCGHDNFMICPTRWRP
jgi:glyoxylase-like metal-dependent hydrolase (beta-lactamase superfamily II)